MRKCSSVGVVVGLLGIASVAITSLSMASDTTARATTPARVRLMTNSQYANTIAYMFGTDISFRAPFSPRRRTEGLLASSAASAGVTPSDMNQLQRSAAAIASQVLESGDTSREVGHRDLLVPCKPADVEKADDVCAAKFISRTGRLLFRRPLEKQKLTELVSQAHSAADTLGGFYAGLRVVLEGMLVDPLVLMVVDTTEPDPKHPDQRRLDAFSLASRLSYFLWDAAPDDAVLKSAESGEILTAKGRAKVVDMMIASPRFKDGVRAFFDDMFAFDAFANLSKDAVTYPGINAQTLADAREQTLLTVVDHLTTRNGDYRDLFTTRKTFISPELALVYNIPTTPGWRPYEFPSDSPRIGILTQISFVASHAHPTRSSPTLRGKAMRELILCQTVPPPPPNVDFSIIEDPNPRIKTIRDRLTAHRSNPVCAGCHKITDPIGLALENFDGAGQYRETEKGAAIDISGNLDGKDFATVAGLSEAVHDHPAVPSCLVRRLYSYGTGGPLAADDDATITEMTAQFAKAGYRVPNLMRAIASSSGFSNVTVDTTSSNASSNGDQK